MNNLTPDAYTGPDLSYLDRDLPVHMTNNYLFRAIMQENNHVLKALVCSLLHLDKANVSDVLIQNPIELGRHVDEKDFFLDIKLLLDSRMVVNLELQVINERNWVERSQCYLCRSFDSLNRGESYKDVLPAVQIGILNYTLFPDAPEFYATYRLMNIKSHKIYDDKLRLSVLDLKHIELTTEEDKAYQVDCWARLFKATTWKEMKDLAEHDSIFSEAVRTAVVLSGDEKIRLQCEAREDYYRRTGWKDNYIEQQTQKIQQLDTKIQHLSSENQRLRQLLKSAGISDTQEK